MWKALYNHWWAKWHVWLAILAAVSKASEALKHVFMFTLLILLFIILSMNLNKKTSMFSCFYNQIKWWGQSFWCYRLLSERKKFIPSESRSSFTCSAVRFFFIAPERNTNYIISLAYNRNMQIIFKNNPNELNEKSNKNILYYLWF